MTTPPRAPARPSAAAPTPRPAGRPPLARRIATYVTAAAVAIGLGVLVAVVIVQRLRTGEWRAPTVDDLVTIKRQVTGAPPPVPRVLFLDRRPRRLSAGPDDAAAGVSSVIAHQGDLPRDLPGWKGSDKAWRELVACVRAQFAPFGVTVTDQPPPTPEHILVAVGGKPKDIGVKDPRIAGLAPFNGEVIPRAVVFAFAATQGHQARGVCETIAMEAAHAYGLDHEYLCSDVMSYLKPCGKRTFVDKDVPCGEKKKRACAGGAPTQNSYRRLLAVLGPGRPT